MQLSLPDTDFSSFRCIPIHVYPCTPMYTLIGLLIGLFIHSWARATLAESEILIHLIWAAGLNVCLTISMFPHVPSPLFFFHLLPSHSISRCGSVPPSSCSTVHLFCYRPLLVFLIYTLNLESSATMDQLETETRAQSCFQVWAGWTYVPVG